MKHQSIFRHSITSTLLVISSFFKSRQYIIIYSCDLMYRSIRIQKLAAYVYFEADDLICFFMEEPESRILSIKQIFQSIFVPAQKEPQKIRFVSSKQIQCCNNKLIQFLIDVDPRIQ